jgi:hypothetical protein
MGLAMVLLAVPGTASATPVPDTLHVVRSPGLSRMSPLDVTIRDSTAVRRVYADLLGLPRPRPGVYNCPMDSGVVYHLTFSRGRQVVLTADVQATGCRGVTLSPSDGRSAVDHGKFWGPLANALGVPETALFPQLSLR